MSQTHTFPTLVPTLKRRRQRLRRLTDNKFAEIAARSPVDMAALDEMADLVLARLNRLDHEAEKHKR